MQAPADRTVRPTSDRVKEALFNILTHAALGPDWTGLADARVLDAFAGSGALGIEALSRGAAHVDFIEPDSAVRRHLTRNLTSLGLTNRANIHAFDACHPPSHSGTAATLVLLDPPYGSGLGHQALPALAARGWLAPGAVAVLEESGPKPPDIPGFSLMQTRRYGRTSLVFVGRNDPTDAGRHPAL